MMTAPKTLSWILLLLLLYRCYQRIFNEQTNFQILDARFHQLCCLKVSLQLVELDTSKSFARKQKWTQSIFTLFTLIWEVVFNTMHTVTVNCAILVYNMHWFISCLQFHHTAIWVSPLLMTCLLPYILMGLLPRPTSMPTWFIGVLFHEMSICWHVPISPMCVHCLSTIVLYGPHM